MVTKSEINNNYIAQKLLYIPKRLQNACSEVPCELV